MSRLLPFTWESLVLELHGLAIPEPSPFDAATIQAQRLQRENEALCSIPENERWIFVMIWRTQRFRFPHGYPADFDLQQVARAMLRTTTDDNTPIVTQHRLWKTTNNTQVEAELTNWRQVDHTNWFQTCAVNDNGEPTNRIPLRASPEELLALMIMNDNHPSAMAEIRGRWNLPIMPPTLLCHGLEAMDLAWLLASNDPPEYWEGSDWFSLEWRSKWAEKPFRTYKARQEWPNVELNLLFREDHLADQYLGVEEEAEGSETVGQVDDENWAPYKAQIVQLRKDVTDFEDKLRSTGSTDLQAVLSAKKAVVEAFEKVSKTIDKALNSHAEVDQAFAKVDEALNQANRAHSNARRAAAELDKAQDEVDNALKHSQEVDDKVCEGFENANKLLKEFTSGRLAESRDNLQRREESLNAEIMALRKENAQLKKKLDLLQNEAQDVSMLSSSSDPSSSSSWFGSPGSSS